MEPDYMMEIIKKKLTQTGWEKIEYSFKNYFI